MATTTKTRGPRDHLGRVEMAEKVLAVLTDEPQSGSAIGRKLGISAAPAPALAILEANNQAHRIPRVGWVKGPAPDTHADGDEPREEFEFPYRFAIVPLDQMFVDKAYQRPLTSFVDRIALRFNPVLFGTPALSERGDGNFAIIDGQTRWAAARRKGIRAVPAIVFEGLTAQQEAEMFARLQKERRGMTSWDRFRAQLAAKDPESLAIKKLAEMAGYKLGHEAGRMKSMQALEACYRSDEFLLERTLMAFNRAFPTEVPEAIHIRGLHYWYRNPNSQFRAAKTEIDDEKLVRRLRTAGLDGLKRNANGAREFSQVQSSSGAQFMAMAIDKAYKSGARV